MITFLRARTAAANASRQQSAATTKAKPWAAEQAPEETDTESPAYAEAMLAQLKQQEEELKRKIEERRRQSGQ